jgi:ankyrin repeat protein
MMSFDYYKPIYRLYWAISTNNVNYVKQLPDKSIVNDYCHDETPLHHAVRLDRYEIIVLLLKYKANINALDEEGQTCLDVAYEKKISNNTIRFLQRQGAYRSNSFMLKLEKLCVCAYCFGEGEEEKIQYDETF